MRSCVENTYLMNLTRREKHIVIASLLLLFVLAFIPQQIITDNEPLFLLVSAAPMGFYIATDPERIKRKFEKMEKDL